MARTTIKQVRSSLKMWGMFWASKELGAGFASVSVTAKICETLKTEIWTSSDLHLFSHLSDNMFEPDHINQVSKAIGKLSLNYRLAISNKYIKGRPNDNYYTIQAENELIGLL